LENTAQRGMKLMN